MPGRTKLGVTRLTNRLEDVVRFYRGGLGLAELRRFEKLGGTVGVKLGLPGAPHYLEFTDAHEHLVSKAPTTDSILEICLASEGEWTDAVTRIEKSGYEAVPSSSPFWNQHELTFEDPDGYRVVLQHADRER